MSYEAFLSQFTDYRPITNYWDRFSIADMNGERDVIALYDKIFSECSKDYKKLTELVMVLNHRIWLFAQVPGHERLAELYDSLWRKADNYACNHLKGEELTYFYRTTD
jgi:hypothetical protein